MLRTSLCAALCLLATGCYLPLRQGMLMQEDIAKVRVELEEAREAAEKARQKAVEEQEAAIARLDEALEQLNRAAKKTGADLAVDLEQARDEVARLRGAFELAENEVRSLKQTLEDLRAAEQVALAERDRRLEALEAEKKGRDDAEAARRKAAERPATKDAYYQLAKDALDKGDYATARTVFYEFVAKWKDDALTANAFYWLGESYYAERKYREAILELRKVGDQFPKSDKAPDALLKIAFAFQAMGLESDAKVFLEEVVRVHPKSNAARLAKERLAQPAKKKGK